jgi:hypothetical protein
MDLWPRRFYVYLGARRAPHNDVKAWVQRYTPPLCALMPDRLPDPAANTANQANFANLSRMLLENQMVSNQGAHVTCTIARRALILVCSQPQHLHPPPRVNS